MYKNFARNLLCQVQQIKYHLQPPPDPQGPESMQITNITAVAFQVDMFKANFCG